MHVLFVSHSFPLPGQPLSNVGGMQRIATGFHDALAERPDVRLSTGLLETTWEATPYRLPAFLAGQLRTIPKRVRETQVDVVLFSSMVTASLAVVLRRRLAAAGALVAAIPVGRDVTIPFPPYQALVPRVFRALDLAFPISQATAEEGFRRGLDPARTHVIPCGVDAALFGPPADRRAARRELLDGLGAPAAGLPPDALLLCGVGRHQERKGFQWFVDEVMPRLPDDVVFLLAGEGPMTPAIRAAVERHGLQARVRLLGRVSEEALRRLYRGGDLFVMPNVPVAGDIEGFGVVMLEAGLCGMPVMAADLEGIRDVIGEASGRLLPSRDAAAFAAAIGAYHHAPERLAAASEAATAYTRAHFTWAAIAGRFVDHFQAALAARGAVAA